MQKIHVFLLIFLFGIKTAFSQFIDLDNLNNNQKIVRSVKQIYLEDYPTAFNPSIIKFRDNFLLVFRYCPDVLKEPWISYIGFVLLDEFFDPISEPQLLTTRDSPHKTPCQSEDARLFTYKNRLFLVYNDNLEVTNPSCWDRRDMFTSEVFYEDGKFSLSLPLKLFCKEKYSVQKWQKNWMPFEKNNSLFYIYSINPHEILYSNFLNGECFRFYSTWKHFQWDWGHLKGSTPPEMVDGEFLSFFHSGIKTASQVSNGSDIWHYFFGAYTFSSSPPFETKKASSIPISTKEFYTRSNREKRVIYPGGFVVQDQNIYLAYGKDDCEIWIATLDKKRLVDSLISVSDE